MHDLAREWTVKYSRICDVDSGSKSERFERLMGLIGHICSVTMKQNKRPNDEVLSEATETLILKLVEGAGLEGRFLQELKIPTGSVHSKIEAPVPGEPIDVW